MLSGYFKTMTAEVEIKNAKSSLRIKGGVGGGGTMECSGLAEGGSEGMNVNSRADG